MTNRELLELAAKAAGYEIKYWVGDCPRIQVPGSHMVVPWNPLDVNNGDDGVALARDLLISVNMDGVIAEAFCTKSNILKIERISEKRLDIVSVASLAVVKVAAEIGKAMP